MIDRDIKNLDELECKIFLFSYLEITLMGSLLLGGVFLLGMAISESLILNDNPNIKGHSWNDVVAIMAVVCNVFTFAGLGILDARQMLLMKTLTIEIKIAKTELSSYEGINFEQNLIYDQYGNKFIVCDRLFQLLRRNDIIEAEVRREKILKIHYINGSNRLSKV